MMELAELLQIYVLKQWDVQALDHIVVQMEIVWKVTTIVQVHYVLLIILNAKRLVNA